MRPQTGEISIIRKSIKALSLSACLMLIGCPPDGVKVTPATPMLVNVRLVGQRVCGPFATSLVGQIFTFTCPPLPTTTSSGWKLTPLWTPSIANPTRSHPNRTVVLTINGPSLTDIDVELVLNEHGGQNLPLKPVDATHPPGPGEVRATSQVGVAATDNGNQKTWTVTAVLSTCMEYRHLQIFDRYGSSRSTPLDVYLVREWTNENETACVDTTGTWWAQAGRAGVGDPGHPSSGPCPGGAPRQLFGVCENCSAYHPPDANVYTGYEGCSWDEVLSVFGYKDPAGIKNQICTIKQVASLEECEGPP